MSDGFSGAGLLSWQLTTNRILDGIGARKDAAAAQQNTQNAYDHLQWQIDQLAGSHEWLRSQCEKFANETRHNFDVLEKRIAALQKENAALRGSGGTQGQSLAQQIAALKAENEQLQNSNEAKDRIIRHIEDEYGRENSLLDSELTKTQMELAKFTGEKHWYKRPGDTVRTTGS